jgi:hypothetical protein
LKVLLAIFLAVLIGCGSKAAAAPVCVVPVSGSEVSELTFPRVFALKDAGWLISLEGELFHLDMNAQKFQAVSGPRLDTVSIEKAVGDGTWLILAEGGLYRFNASTRKLEGIPGPETGKISRTVPLDDARRLVSAERGLFRLDVNKQKLERVSGPEIGDAYFYPQLLKDGGWFISTERGLFRLDADAQKLEAVPGPDTGKISVDRLGDGGWLISGERGLFRLDADAQKLEALPGPDTGKISGTSVLRDAAWREVAWLISAERGLFRLGVNPLKLEPVWGSETGKVLGIGTLTDAARQGAGWLISAERGLFRIDANAQKVEAVSGPEIGTYFSTRALKEGGWLVSGELGLFRLDAKAQKVEAMSGSGIGKVSTFDFLTELKDGGWLLRAERGLFRLDANAQRFEAVSGAGTGKISAITDLPDGGWLIGAERGLFRLDANADKVENVSTTGEVAGVSEIKPIEVNSWEAFDEKSRVHGGWFVTAKRGLFHVDSKAERAVAVPRPDTGDLYNFWLLSDGRWLIAAARGLFLAFPTLIDAKLESDDQSEIKRIRPGQGPTETHWTFRHGCARVADILGLHIAVSPADANRRGEKPSRQPGYRFTLQEGTANFVANISFPTKGDWKLQTIAAATGTDIPIGLPISIQIDDNIFDFIARQWKWFAGSLGVIYIGAFACVFLFAHWNRRAVGILLDPVWSKVGVWPFFLLRQWPPAQLWVLECWFQAARAAAHTDTPFLDVPAQRLNGVAVEATTLLAQLKSEPRLWLQGRAGMGKSEVFLAWGRGYYAAETLASAARRYDFVLVMLPVRQFATLPMDQNHPENWVIEAVRRRLEQFGAEFTDTSLVQAMLRSGIFALAFDGMNEADRDTSLMAFARAFPQVRILVTSQSDGPEEFQTWRLPRDVSGHAEALLKLWLGEERGGALADRIVRQGLMPYLLSGYDLRLIADLAGSDPERAPLPTDRIELYRAVLSRAEMEDGSALPLDSLKKLAWTMIIEGRREIRQADGNVLGSRALEALVKDTVRIVRRVGDAYEFRHDQMRSFLAALWLAEETPNAAAMIQRLEGSPVWQSSRRDQEEVWRFLADLLTLGSDLAIVWRFTLAEPSRAFLQAALLSRAKAAGLSLVA